MDVLVERKEFENDEEAVGKWKIKDIVTTKDQFVYGYPKCPEAVESIWSELYFPEGDEPYWFLKGWTKGFLYLEATPLITVLFDSDAPDVYITSISLIFNNFLI